MQCHGLLTRHSTTQPREYYAVIQRAQCWWATALGLQRRGLELRPPGFKKTTQPLGHCTSLSIPTSSLRPDLPVTPKHVGFQWIDKEIKCWNCPIYPNLLRPVEHCFELLFEIIKFDQPTKHAIVLIASVCLHLGYSIRATTVLHVSYSTIWYRNNFWLRSSPRLHEQSYHTFLRSDLSIWHREQKTTP